MPPRNSPNIWFRNLVKAVRVFGTRGSDQDCLSASKYVLIPWSAGRSICMFTREVGDLWYVLRKAGELGGAANLTPPSWYWDSHTFMLFFQYCALFVWYFLVLFVFCFFKTHFLSWSINESPLFMPMTLLRYHSLRSTSSFGTYLLHLGFLARISIQHKAAWPPCKHEVGYRRINVLEAAQCGYRVPFP